MAREPFKRERSEAGIGIDIRTEGPNRKPALAMVGTAATVTGCSLLVVFPLGIDSLRDSQDDGRSWSYAVIGRSLYSICRHALRFVQQVFHPVLVIAPMFIRRSPWLVWRDRSS